MMLRIATQSVAACAVTVTLPSEVRYSRYYRNYGFYCFCGTSSTDAVRDLGHAPKNGGMDRLGNRSVVHSNVKGSVSYGTKVRWHEGDPGSNDVILYIPNSKDNRNASAQYCAIRPMICEGSTTLTPRFDSRFASCRITCSIAGDATRISVTIKVDLGPYTNPRTGAKSEVSNGYASLVLTPDHPKIEAYYHCGRKSNTGSKMGVTVKCAFPRSVTSFNSVYADKLIPGFEPRIWQIQLAHQLFVARRITIGDSKAISDAFQAIRLASFNGLAFTRDTSRLLQDTSRLIRDLRRARRHPRRIASIWLSYRYGHRLYYKDCMELRKAVLNVNHQKPLKFRGRHTEVIHLVKGSTTRVEHNFTLYCDRFCSADQDLESGLRSLDFWPSAENLWDLVPYSFVADWFINITDICKRYDMRQDILRYPIRGAVLSVKCTTTSAVNHSQGCGEASVTYYVRMPLTPAALSTTLLSLNLSLMTGLSLVHVADAFALAVSRRR